MSEQKYSFRDETLNLEQAYYYTLLLCVEADSFSFAITANHLLLAYETNHPLDELTHPGPLHELLFAGYKKHIVALSSSVFSLVPGALFNAAHIADFARLLDVKENERVLEQVIDEKNHVIYKVEGQQWAAVNKFEPKILAFSAEGWIRVIAQHNPLNNKLYVNIGKGIVEFLNFKNNDLRFYNSFAFKDADDIVYFSTLVTAELELEPRATTFIFSGDITDQDETYNRLAEFFADVRLNTIRLLDLPAEVAPHQVLSLAALTLCESSEAV